jgi:hypothetical protein
MNIHKEFTNQIIIKRKAAIRDLITGERSLQLELLKPDSGKLIDELDRIFYTIDFLVRNKLIECTRHSNSSVITLFEGFSFDHKNVDRGVSQVHAIYFLQNKLNEGGAYSWNIEMNPGLLAFVKNGYKTDEQLKERNNYLLVIGIAILSSTLTAILTALLTKAPIIFTS